MESYIKERCHYDITSSLWKNGVGINDSTLVSRRIGDLSKGKFYKVVNLALKREDNKVTRVEQSFHKIHGSYKDEAHIYIDYIRTNTI